MDTHTYTHIHTYIHTYIVYIHTYRHIHIYIYTYVHTYTHNIYIYIFTYTHIHTYNLKCLSPVRMQQLIRIICLHLVLTMATFFRTMVTLTVTASPKRRT